MTAPPMVRACAGKRGYRSWPEADKVRRRMLRMDDKARGLNIYGCAWCELFHIGNGGEWW